MAKSLMARSMVCAWDCSDGDAFGGRAQSGYIFTYAFAMVIGHCGLVTWMTLRGGGN